MPTRKKQQSAGGILPPALAQKLLMDMMRVAPPNRILPVTGAAGAGFKLGGRGFKLGGRGFKLGGRGVFAPRY